MERGSFCFNNIKNNNKHLTDLNRLYNNLPSCTTPVTYFVFFSLNSSFLSACSLQEAVYCWDTSRNSLCFCRIQISVLNLQCEMYQPSLAVLGRSLHPTAAPLLAAALPGSPRAGSSPSDAGTRAQRVATHCCKNPRCLQDLRIMPHVL